MRYHRENANLRYQEAFNCQWRTMDKRQIRDPFYQRSFDRAVMVAQWYVELEVAADLAAHWHVDAKVHPFFPKNEHFSPKNEKCCLGYTLFGSVAHCPV